MVLQELLLFVFKAGLPSICTFHPLGVTVASQQGRDVQILTVC